MSANAYLFTFTLQNGGLCMSMNPVTRKTKGYALQIGAGNDPDRAFVKVREKRQYDYWTRSLDEATLFPTLEAAVQRVSEIAFFVGVRIGDWDRTRYQGPDYRVVRVIETVGAPTTTDSWYIRRGQDMWFKHGAWFTSDKAGATRFSGIGHAINALRDWRDALNNRPDAWGAPLTIEQSTTTQPGATTLTTEALE